MLDLKHFSISPLFMSQVIVSLSGKKIESTANYTVYLQSNEKN